MVIKNRQSTRVWYSIDLESHKGDLSDLDLIENSSHACFMEFYKIKSFPFYLTIPIFEPVLHYLYELENSFENIEIKVLDIYKKVFYIKSEVPENTTAYGGWGWYERGSKDSYVDFLSDKVPPKYIMKLKVKSVQECLLPIIKINPSELYKEETRWIVAYAMAVLTRQLSFLEKCSITHDLIEKKDVLEFLAEVRNKAIEMCKGYTAHLLIDSSIDESLTKEWIKLLDNLKLANKVLKHGTVISYLRIPSQNLIMKQLLRGINNV